MANQITHIVLAEKLQNELREKFDWKAFLVGTVFPDIRYLKVIDRNESHPDVHSFQDILDEQNSFVAGLKYHSLVDEVRERYVVEKGVYDLIAPSKFVIPALKFYEDEVLYSKVSDWNQHAEFLNEVFPEEIELVQQVDKVKMWHSLIQEYFKEAPTEATRKKFIIGGGYPKEAVFEINELIKQMRQMPEIRANILELYEKWDLLIKRGL